MYESYEVAFPIWGLHGSSENDLVIVLLFLYDKYPDGYNFFCFYMILNWRDSNITGCCLDCVNPHPTGPD